VTGETTHELIVQEMPVHNHLAEVGASATTNDPTNVYLATPTVNARLGSLYSSSASSTASAATIQSSGGSQPHNNLQPLLTLNYCIALVGIFPSQN
jgi:microcystin-dependent protein